MDQQTHEWPSNSTWLILITYIAWNPTSMDICPARLLHLPSSHVWPQLLHEDPNMNKAVVRLRFLMFLWGSQEDRLAASSSFTEKLHWKHPRKKKGWTRLQLNSSSYLYIYIHLHALSKTVSKKNMQIAVNIYKITLNHLKQLEPPGSNSRLRSLRASSVSSRGKWWSTAPDSGASWLIQLEMDIMGILMGYNIYIDYIYIHIIH